MSEIEMIIDFLRRNGKSTALRIARDIGLDKATVNKHLYKLQTSQLLVSSKEKPPVWDLMEKTSEILKSPEQTSLTTSGETCEEKDVRDLLSTGGLKASQIAKELGQSRRNVNSLLYLMEKTGTVQKCDKTNSWMLKDEESNEGYNQESNHRLGSTAGLSQSFDVITKLGEGGFGWVYKVRHKYDGKIYAVKKVVLTGKADSEVKALARLDHPNIVRYITCWSDSENCTSIQERNQVFNTSGSSSGGVIFERANGEEKNDDDDDDDDEDDDDDKDDDDDDDVTSGMESLGVTSASIYLFIQMEFCAGGTLTKWIKDRNYMNKQRTPLEIHKIFYEIVSGVEYIHSNKLIHRDLKPDNILFGTDGKVKIGDFGLVAAQSNHSGGAIERSKRRGTPQYMSPEQENKRDYDEKTDIFPLDSYGLRCFGNCPLLLLDLRNHIFPEGFCESYPTETKFIKEMLSSTPEDRPHAEDIKKILRYVSIWNRIC